MTRSRRRHAPHLTVDDLDDLATVARSVGLDHLGTCTARPWTATRDRLDAHRAAGLHADMEFTLRNPARSSDPSRLLRSARTLVVGAYGYGQELEAPPDAMAVPARVARYATADHYGRLETALGAVADHLRGLGARAAVIADSNGLVDREAAWRAGIGWYGKNSLLLVPGSGSWYVLGSVVTDAAVDPAVPVPVPVSDGCGTCTRCVDRCPTRAIVADGVVDAGRCLSWLLQSPAPFPLEFRVALGDRIYGCDDCQEVCPPNRAVELRSRRTDAWPVEDDPGPWLDACRLLELDDEALLAEVGRWYIAGRDPSIVRRNLLLVLGNSGRADDARVRRLVEQYRVGPDASLAEHAHWAAGRLASLAAAARSDDN